MLSAAAPSAAVGVASSGPFQVSRAYVDGSRWAPEFRQAEASWPGYGILVGDTHDSGPIPFMFPWVNVDRLTVTFNSPVRPAQVDDLRVYGVTVRDYPVLSVETINETVGFSNRFRVTWTLAQPLRNDRVLFVIDGGPNGVKDTAGIGRQLDGDADLVPGGDYRLRLNALPGNVNSSDPVDGMDVASVRKSLHSTMADRDRGNRSYSTTADLNGDGRINLTDLVEVRRRVFDRLPFTQPTGAPAAAAAGNSAAAQASTPLRLRPVSRGLFGATPILA